MGLSRGVTARAKSVFTYSDLSSTNVTGKHTKLNLVPTVEPATNTLVQWVSTQHLTTVVHVLFEKFDEHNVVILERFEHLRDDPTVGLARVRVSSGDLRRKGWGRVRMSLNREHSPNFAVPTMVPTLVLVIIPYCPTR